MELLPASSSQLRLAQQGLNPRASQRTPTQLHTATTTYCESFSRKNPSTTMFRCEDSLQLQRSTQCSVVRFVAVERGHSLHAIFSSVTKVSRSATPKLTTTDHQGPNPTVQQSCTKHLSSAGLDSLSRAQKLTAAQGNIRHTQWLLPGLPQCHRESVRQLINGGASYVFVPERKPLVLTRCFCLQLMPASETRSRKEKAECDLAGAEHLVQRCPKFTWDGLFTSVEQQHLRRGKGDFRCSSKDVRSQVCR